MRLMVLGAGGPAAENFIKSLRTAYPDAWILGCDVNPWLLELSTADERVLLETRPIDQDHGEELGLLAAQCDVSMIHAQPDEEALFLAIQSVFDFKQLVFTPSYQVVAACQDKLVCAQVLGELAPASAAWVTPNGTRDHWHDVDMYNGSPIVQPRWMRARRGAGSLAAKQVDEYRDALAWEYTWRGRVAPEDFMLAEVLPGRDVSYTGVWWRGEPVSAACRERVEYADTRTPSGQSSSPRVARLVSDDYVFDVAEAAVRIVNKACDVEPHGVFYVDMREDAVGRPRVTEINAGRFNTTQNFYTEAGMNLVGEYVELHHVNPSTRVFPGGVRLKRDDEAYWVRQPDMGHRLLTRTRVGA
jgi:carbamoyl-phosphate synthase large subunit